MGCGLSNKTTATITTTATDNDESIPDECATLYQENKIRKILPTYSGNRSHQSSDYVNTFSPRTVTSSHSSSFNPMKSLSNNNNTELNLRLIGDVQNEPINLLNPIYGYEHYSLVSLEEACKPLLPFINDLNYYISIAKQNSKKPSDNLTIDESASIYLYTLEWSDALYRKLNFNLRQSKRDKLIPWFSYLKLFLTALFKLPNIESDIIWRGNEIKFDGYKTGTYHIWWAFSSCTLNLKLLESQMYLGKQKNRTIFSIQVLNGKNIRNHSYFKNDNEILLMPGTYFKVINEGSSSSNLHIIQLKQIQPPHVLLEPPFQIAEEEEEDEDDEGFETERSIDYKKNHMRAQTNSPMQSSENKNSPIQEEKLTFTKISNALNNRSEIPNGYAGFNWINIDYIGKNYIRRNKPNWMKLFNFYEVIAITNRHDHFPMSIERINGQTFTVHSIEVSSVDEKGQLSINGLLNGEKVCEGVLDLDNQQVLVVDLEWEDIDTLEFNANIKIAIHSVIFENVDF
ncbi:unnamed protein product [Rotaria sordida]|uniref:NAD(P)(+)--arginine ADP-ribosyltransferase n=1 Tax=Rotaria sordida TaxID=392033 RepID=A0A814Z2G8_9BILA|nr:unnamed protein product [Rotaria sordida]